MVGQHDAGGGMLYDGSRNTAAAKPSAFYRHCQQ